MRKLCKKIASMLLATILLFAMASMETSALTQNDIISWMDSKNGTTIYDGGNQCVAAFNSYLRYWGISNPISKYPVNYAYQIFNYNAPDGWQKISGSGNYQVGDVVIWGSSVGGGSGHVGMVYSTSGGTVKIFDQNYVARNVCGIHNVAQTSAIRGVFRPNISNQNPHWYDSYNIVDLGMDFYATIAKNTSSKAVGLDSNNNIVVRPYEVFNDQIWHFIKQSDGGYKIINALTDTYIVGDTVASLEYEVGNNNKIWYITKDSNGYSLIHLSGGSVKYLHPSWGLWNDNNSISLNDAVDYVDINFIEGNDNLPLNINISTDKTIYYKGDTLNLTWSKSKYAFDYEIDIWKDNGEHLLDTSTRNNTYSLNNLETGYYGIYIYASNTIGKSQSAVIHFYVSQDLGEEDFYSVICNDDGLALDIDSNNKIIVSEYTVYNNQIWEFQKQVSGCYKIRNVKFDKFISIDKENIILTNNAEKSTEWYIGSKNGKYTIYTSINGYTYYLQFSENQNDEHTVCVSQKLSTQNLNRIYGNDNSPAPFGIYIPNGCFSKDDDIILKWDRSKYAFSYIVEIINENGLIERFETVENKFNIKNLVDGKYLLSIKAVNNIGTFSKDNLEFFIKSNEYTDTLKYKVISVNKIGDVDRDGELTVKDATEIQKYIVEIAKFDDEQLKLADVDGDKDITVKDATTIQKIIVEAI